VLEMSEDRIRDMGLKVRELNGLFYIIDKVNDSWIYEPDTHILKHSNKSTFQKIQYHFQTDNIKDLDHCLKYITAHANKYTRLVDKRRVRENRMDYLFSLI